MELGDHPSVSMGAAVTLAWKAHETTVLDINVYEFFRFEEKERQLPKKMCLALQLQAPSRTPSLDTQTRHAILRRAGYSWPEIKAATQEAAKVRKQRERTNQLGPLNRVEDLGRSVGRFYNKNRKSSKSGQRQEQEAQ